MPPLAPLLSLHEENRSVNITVTGANFNTHFEFFCIYRHHLRTEPLITNATIESETVIKCPVPATTEDINTIVTEQGPLFLDLEVRPEWRTAPYGVTLHPKNAPIFGIGRVLLYEPPYIS